jgi:uncharacterized protein YdeI (YjbR/CyaY-like superfamily)
MKSLYVKNRSEWRSWLRKNYRRAQEIWLLYYKKNSGKPRIPYDDAVEEALCFGWIDGKTRRIDEARYAQRFTPRRPQSCWSASNIQRAKKMITDGRMMPAGLQAFSFHSRRKMPSIPTQLPKNLEQRFKRQTAALENFNRFPPFYRRMTVRWVASAKKEETRLKRLNRLIEFSARNTRIKFM